MEATPAKQKSGFIVSFRLKPSQSFVGLQVKITTGDGYELSFHDDMVWLRFDATSDEWLRQLDIGKQALRTILAILTIQTEYPFELEPIQWIEDKPRNESLAANYVLGKLENLTAQREIPSVKVGDIRKGEIHIHLASQNVHYRYALLDYSVALSIPQEAIVFCSRSLEWIESYFDTINRSLSQKKKLGARRLMRDNLNLPDNYLTKFLTIANDTVIARHGHKIGTIRPPKIEEIRFCVFFNRIVLDRFGGYIWYSRSNALPPRWVYPADEKPPSDLFKDKNPGLIQDLGQILSGQMS
jgi:hypothetical protein